MMVCSVPWASTGLEPIKSTRTARGCAERGFRAIARVRLLLERLRRNDATRKRKAAFTLDGASMVQRDPRPPREPALALDGCNGDEAVRRRILWFAHERKLPLTETEKDLKCRIHNMGDFADRHKVSLDWLLISDLQGLRRMPVQQSASILTATNVVKLYAKLTMERRCKLSLMIAVLLDEAVS